MRSNLFENIKISYKKWQEHIQEIVTTIKGFQDQMEESVYRECIQSAQRYINSRGWEEPMGYDT